MSLAAVCGLTLCLLIAAYGAEPRSRALFDGRTFAGWEGDTKSTWRIEEGTLTAGSQDAVTPRNEFLSTTKTYENFDLRLKFRIVGDKHVNAGVQFRTQRIPNHHEVSGYQADIGPGYYGALYDESRRNRLLATPDPAIVEQALAAVGADGWHDYRIKANGPHIELWLNGVQTVDYTEEEAGIDTSGIIAVQIHGGMQATISYKDIELTELPAAK